jgi:hypothetical protein
MSKEREGGVLWHQVVKVVQELAKKVMTNIMRSQEGTKEDEFKYVMGEEERQRMFNILWKENLNKLLHLQYQLSNLV